MEQITKVWHKRMHFGKNDLSMSLIKIIIIFLLIIGLTSCANNKTIIFPPPGLDEFIPAVAKGEWNPKND